MEILLKNNEYEIDIQDDYAASSLHSTREKIIQLANCKNLIVNEQVNSNWILSDHLMVDFVINTAVVVKKDIHLKVNKKRLENPRVKRIIRPSSIDLLDLKQMIQCKYINCFTKILSRS